MQITLFTDQEQVIEAWEKEFADISGVSPYEGSLEDIPEADCLVTAGNSFGIMDGGLDAAVRTQFPDAASNVKSVISDAFFGELPVGQAIIVPTGDDLFPHLCYAPTMRFPRQVAAEIVYDVTRTVLLKVIEFNEAELSEDREENTIASIAIPSFCTRTGGVGAFKAAHMMRMAYESIYVGHDDYSDWDHIEQHLKKLYGKT